jgi:hypothetical protein
LETKTLVKQIKAKNRASNLYIFVSVLSGIGTTLLTVMLVHLLFAGELTRKRIWQIGAGIIVKNIVRFPGILFSRPEKESNLFFCLWAISSPDVNLIISG